MNDRIVIDASVAAKWFLKDELEGNVDLAEDLLASLIEGAVELHAPRGFHFEVCSLLTKACLTRGPEPQGGKVRLRTQDAVDHVRDLFNLPIQIHDMTVDEAVESLEMAVSYHKGYCDMAYLRLAWQLNCPWCTADRRVLKAVPSGFPSRCVLPLADIRRLF